MLFRSHGVLGHVCFPTRSKKNTKKTSTTKTITFVLFIVELSTLEHLKRSWHQSCSPILSKKSKICFIPCWVCFCCVCLYLCFFLPGGGKTDILQSPAAHDNYASSTSSLNTNCIESTFVAVLIYHSTSFMTNV